MKIKIINSSSTLTMEEDVNRFIQDKIVIDIKYSVYTENNTTKHSVCILYEVVNDKCKDYITGSACITNYSSKEVEL